MAIKYYTGSTNTGKVSIASNEDNGAKSRSWMKTVKFGQLKIQLKLELEL